MATTVKCRSSNKQSPLYSPCECCGELVTAFGCACNGNGALGTSNAGQMSNGSSGNTVPIIVQAPAAPAPIIIQQAPRESVYPVFIPLVQSVREDNGNEAEGIKNQQARGQAMPTVPVQQYTSGNGAVETPLPTAFVDSPVPVTTSPLPATTPGAAQTKAPVQGEAQSTRLAPESTSPAGVSGQPIIINITNSQDRDSNNRSLFAPRIHDESFNSRERSEVEKSQTNKSVSAHGQTIKAKRGRIVHVKPLQEKVNSAQVVNRAERESSKESMYHYVGWS